MEIAAFIAPLTLLLGAGLFAAGLLSFFGVHFFATRAAERAAFALGLALIVGAEFLFASSGMSLRFLNGQRSDVLECRLDAETALPQERHRDSPVLQERIRECMDRAGYRWTSRHRRCAEAPVATNPFCYLPTRPFDRTVTRILMFFE